MGIVSFVTSSEKWIHTVNQQRPQLQHTQSELQTTQTELIQSQSQL